MADGKIYIIVTDQLPGGQEPVPGADTEKKDKDKENTLAKFAQHKFFNLIESQAKQAINYSISNIGNFTGDYVAQTHMQDAMAIVNDALDIGTAAYAGLKLSGGSPWGALIGAGVAVAGKAITKVEQVIAGNAQNARQNRAISQLRERAGLNSTNNGSRGTEY